MNRFKLIMKPLIKWFLIILYLEIVFGMTIFSNYARDSIFNIIIYSFIMACFFSIVIGIFNDKINRIITNIILGILGFLYGLQLVFYRTLKSFFSISVLGLSDQLESFMGETIHFIIINLPFIILLFLPFIIHLIWKKKIKVYQNKTVNYIIYSIFLVLSISILGIKVNMGKKVDNSIYNLYHNVNEISLNIERLGVLNSYGIDIYRSIFGFNGTIEVIKEENKNNDDIITYDANTLELNFDKETNNKDIKTINEYMKNNPGTLKNKYTGLFKDYNLIYITAESFDEIAISEELTPTLYKLVHSGFEFTNYYTPNNLSTIGGEFQSLTGLYPDNSILSKWRSGTNYFPYGLGTVFKNLDYNTYAYHNNWYAFQDRDKYLKSQGFTNYLGCYNGLEKRINCKKWPQSDLEMIDKTITDYIDSDKPFLAYYMTVSGHFDYSFSENSMASKNEKYVRDLKVPTSAKAYVATQIELDRALESLIKKLDEADKIDNTLIVLLADHYPYDLDLKSVNSLSSYERDSVVEVNHNALIIWNNKIKNIKIDKSCMSSDVLPTVYNLFGVEYDSRLFTGNDIFSSREGLAILKNHSFVSDKGTYFASNGKFIPKEGEEIAEDYVSNINKIVNNRLNISKLILKNNYYNYLLK